MSISLGQVYCIEIEYFIIIVLEDRIRFTGIRGLFFVIVKL